jgi:hypothetical protein
MTAQAAGTGLVVDLCDEVIDAAAAVGSVAFGHSYDNPAAITPCNCSRTLLPIAR